MKKSQNKTKLGKALLKGLNEAVAHNNGDLKLRERIVSSPLVEFNSVVTDEVASNLDMFSPGKIPTKNFELLNLSVKINSRALIFNWAVKKIGFGQLTYRMNKRGKVSLDSEGMNKTFCKFILKEAKKRYKENKLTGVEDSQRFLFDAFLQLID